MLPLGDQIGRIRIGDFRAELDSRLS